MRKKIKMIGLDLDGTLLNEEKELTAHTKRVLEEAVRQGVVVLAATGRPLAGVPQIVREVSGMRYVLTANGARVIDQVENRVLVESLIELEDALKVLDILEEYDTLKEFFFKGDGYIAGDKLAQVHDYVKKVHMQNYIRMSRKAVHDLRKAMSEVGGPFDKVQGVFRHMSERNEAFERILKETNLTPTGSLDNNIEINQHGVNKGEGLISLGAILGIDRDEIMACGDGLNDMEMIRKVGFGVAMGNGIDEVKEIADYITVTNDEEGVAKAIEKFVLN